MAEIRWLRCKVGKGMFATEAVVVVNLANGKEMAFFVPIDQVEPTPEVRQELDGRVRVLIQRLEDGAWATIPAPQPAVVPVQDDDLLKVA